MSDETIYSQRKREKKIILNWGKRYENNKKSLLEQAKNKYRGLSNEEKNIKREYIWKK